MPPTNPPSPVDPPFLDDPPVSDPVVAPAVADSSSLDARTTGEPRTAKRRVNDGPTGRARRAAGEDA